MSQDPYEGIPHHDDEPPADELAPPPDPGGTVGPTEDVPPPGVDENGVITTPEELILEHDKKIGGLRADIDELAGTVADLLANPPKSKPAPWNWKHLHGAAAAELMVQLREWVDWYNSHYGVSVDSRIPGCWYRHGPVVEELTAVWIAWRAVYYGHKVPVEGPAYWHDRVLWPAFERITKKQWGMVACVDGHKEPRPQQAPSTDRGFNDFLSEMAAEDMDSSPEKEQNND